MKIKTFSNFINEKINSFYTEDVPEENFVFKAETKGKKYCIEVFFDSKWGTYDYWEYKNGKNMGGGSGYRERDIVKRITQIMKDSKEIDGIKYIPSINKLNVKV